MSWKQGCPYSLFTLDCGVMCVAAGALALTSQIWQTVTITWMYKVNKHFHIRCYIYICNMYLYWNYNKITSLPPSLSSLKCFPWTPSLALIQIHGFFFLNCRYIWVFITATDVKLEKNCQCRCLIFKHDWVFMQGNIRQIKFNKTILLDSSKMTM